MIGKTLLSAIILILNVVCMVTGCYKMTYDSFLHNLYSDQLADLGLLLILRTLSTFVIFVSHGQMLLKCLESVGQHCIAD